MVTCEHVQPQLLDYLYDLLDPFEVLALRQHLDGCAACQAGLAKAQAQQRVIARAAKTKFPSVSFEAPATLPMQPIAKAAARTKRPAWHGWALAACVLVALGGLAAPAAWYWRASSLQQQAAVENARRHDELIAQLTDLRARHESELQAKVKEVAQVQEALTKIGKQTEEKIAAVHNKQVRILISGPQTVQAGAPNNYQIKTLAAGNLNRPVEAKLNTVVRNQKNEVVFQEKDVSCKGAYNFALPSDLRFQPGDQLVLEVEANRDGGPKDTVREQLALASPVYVTHLTTDKPMYRPGETVHFRSLTLDRFSLKPVEEPLILQYLVKKPSGEEMPVMQGLSRLLCPQDGNAVAVLGPDQKPVAGVGAGDYELDANAPGGEYTLIAREARNLFPAQERKFLVNKYENPRLNKELDFTRKSYGPGDEVLAACKVTRAEGGTALANQNVLATVRVDNQTFNAQGQPAGENAIALKTDAEGKVPVRFKLPARMERGDAALSVQFTDGGSVETLVRPVPVVLKKLHIEFFPVGGDLVAGVPNSVYFQARTTLGKPADIAGRIVDERGNVVANVKTVTVADQPAANLGIGSCTLTPEFGKQYELIISSPASIEGRYPLPAVKADGVALNVTEPVLDAGKPFEVTVHSAKKDRMLHVGAYCRGRLMDHQSLTAKQGEAAKVQLIPAQEVGGVYRVTVFEERASNKAERPQLVPVAERLVYRKPAEKLNVAVTPERKHYVPGEKVGCVINTTDEKGKPAPALAMIAVVDKSVITLADEKTHRAMPTHFLLTSEVRRPEDLEYADFLLGSHPEAGPALDRLLATQGWRRFAEQNPAKFKREQKEEADRLLVLNRQNVQQIDTLVEEMKRIREEALAEEARLQEKLAEAAQAQAALVNDAAFQTETQRLQNEAAAAQREQAAALTQLDDLGPQLRAVLLPTLVGAFVLLLVIVVVRSLTRGLTQSMPSFAVASVCALALVVCLYVWQTETRKTLSRANATQLAAAPAPRPGPVAPMGTGAPQGVARGGAARLGERPPLGENAPLAPVAAKPEIRDEAAQELAAVPAMPAGVKDAKDGKELLYRGDAKNRALMLQAGKPGDKGDVKAVRQMQEFRMPNQQDDKMLKKVAELDRKKILLQERDGAFPQLRQAQRGGMVGKAGGLGYAPGQGKGGFGMGGGRALDARRQMMGIEKQEAEGLVAEVMPDPILVREYAHARSPGADPSVRSDFVDTVYWHPVLVLPDGKGKVSFDLCDAVTSYQATVYAHTLDGRLGAVTAALDARLPFTVEPKLPVEVCSSDQLELPISIANNTSEARPVSVRLTSTGLKLAPDQNVKTFTCPADGRGRQTFRCTPSVVEGLAQVVIDGQSDPFADRVVKSLPIVPDGFPVAGSVSDVLEKAAAQTLTLPETWLPGTLKCQVHVYPSTLASLQGGLEALLREPNGCFEQTSTSNYPNLLILNYLKESDQAKPEVERRARELVARGYQKLVSFECLVPAENKRRGYEWFGGTAPAHEALTAYGLLQFRDMAKVAEVDAGMVERTRAYLMSRKDGQGGFQRNPRALDTFGRAPDDITNAYIVWALTEGGKEDDITKELAKLSEQAKTSKDPYFLALVANSLINRGKADDATSLLQKLAVAQKPEGNLDAERTSITGSGGRDLQIETTALTVLAWLKANRPEYTLNVQKAVKWVGQQRGGYGGFGSTQSTILALKALIAFTKANKKTAEEGDVRLLVGGREAAMVHFPAGAQEVITLALSQPEQLLKGGDNKLDIEVTGKNVFPYTLAWSLRTAKPASASGCPVQLTTKLDRVEANEGETVRLTATVENVSGKGQGMTVAILGLPAGLALPEDLKQLKEHAKLRNEGTEQGLISYFETRGREVILYWRDLAPGKKIEVPLDVICRVPGVYRGPASRAYLYYNADRKHWVEPLQVTVKAKAE